LLALLAEAGQLRDTMRFDRIAQVIE